MIVEISGLTLFSVFQSAKRRFFYLSRLFRLICADQENQIHDKWDEALFEVLFAALASTFMFLLTGERCGSAEYCTPAWKVGSCLDTETPSG